MKIPLIQVVSKDRAREDLGEIEGLAVSMSRLGQLQPIVVEAMPDGLYFLLAGGRRLEAAKRLGWTSIEATTKDKCEPLQRLEIELEETLHHKHFTPFEEAKLIKKIHDTKQQIHGKALPGRFATGGWSVRDTAAALGLSSTKIADDITLATGMEQFPQIAELDTRREALRELKRLQKDEHAKLDGKKMEQIILESYLPYTPEFKVDDGCVSLYFADLDGMDVAETMKDAARCLSVSGQGYIFFTLLQLAEVMTAAKAVGLQLDSSPLMWQIKGTDIFVPFIWIAKTLAAPPATVRRTYAYGRDDGFLHEKDKPFTLMHFLIYNSSSKGGFVYDPNAYSGVTLKAAIKTERNCVAVCRQQELYVKAKEAMLKEQA